MAGGDFLYIFAFIILPTAVLVSCIWALILLRKGALLPERPVRQYNVLDAEQEDDGKPEHDLVEETGEHVVIEPARQPEPAVAPVATAPVIDERPAASAEPVAAPVVTEVGDIPVVERTQEMSAVPVGAAPVDAARPEEPPVEPVEAVEAVDSPATQSRTDPDDVLIVPLEEPLPRYANGRTAPDVVNTVDEAAGEVEPVTAAMPDRRRETRRPVRLRPGEADPARSRPRIGQRRTTRRDGGS